jgi:hypothetical protein
MELLTILLSGVISLVSPTGLVVDRVAESQIRKQLFAVEQLQVRIDSAPSYNIINGRADRVLINGRGLFPIREFRLDQLELETDAIALHLKTRKLARPLQAGIHLVLTEKDINQALKSSTVTTRLRNLGIRFLQRREAQQAERYDFLNPQIKLLPEGRARLQVELKEQGYPDTLKIVAEAKPKILNGRSLQLENLKITANGQVTPDSITRSIAQGISKRLDLAQLESSGITARILNFKLEPTTLQTAIFVQIRP